MAQKIERQIIEVSGGKKTASASQKRASAIRKTEALQSPEKKKKVVDAVQTHAVITAQNRSRAVKYRVGAVLMWLIALGFEVLTIMVFKKFLYIPGNTLTYIIIGLAADLLFVVIGSQLWKKANHIDPASEKHPVRFFLWNNMGLIASLICFVPLIILLLKEKDLDEHTKKIATIVAVCVALAAGAASVDWNPVSAEDLAAAQNDTALCTDDGYVYWTQFGKCYHFDEDCQSLRNSATLYKGTIEESFEAKRSKPCSFCASEEAIAHYREQLEEADAFNDLASVIDDDVFDEALPPVDDSFPEDDSEAVYDYDDLDLAAGE